MAFGSKKNKDPTASKAGKDVKEEKKTDDPKKPLQRSDSASSSGSGKGGLGLFGGKKKPRAEYQKEIDELKLKLAAVTTDLELANADLTNAQSDLGKVQAELSQTTSTLQSTKAQLQQTTQKYDTLARWARSPPV